MYSRSATSYIIDKIHKLASALIAVHLCARITIRWTPGHVGLVRNEDVDIEAKRAAEGSQNNTDSHFGILKIPSPISKSVHKQRLREEALQVYKRIFMEGPRVQRLSHF